MLLPGAAVPIAGLPVHARARTGAGAHHLGYDGDAAVGDGALGDVLLKHARDAFVDEQAIAREWRDLNFTAPYLKGGGGPTCLTRPLGRMVEP